MKVREMRNLFLIMALSAIVGCASTTSKPVATETITPPNPPSPLEKQIQSKALSHYLSSIVHRNLGENESALRELRTTADLVPKEPILQLQLLATYYRDEDFENAATMAERALKNNPENVMLNIWLGRIYYQMERHEDAIGAFENAISIDPESTIAYEALAEIEEQTNDLVGATQVYETLTVIRPDSGRLFYRLGVNLLELNELEAAQTAFRKALKTSDEIDAAHFMLGLSYMTQKDFSNAITHFDLFLESNPTHLPTLENILGAQARMGNYDKANQLIKRIVESADVNTVHHLYKSYIQLRYDSPADPNRVITSNGAPILGMLFQAMVLQKAGEPSERLIKNLDSIESDLEYECTNFLNDLLSRFDPVLAGEYLVPAFENLIEENPTSKSLHVILGRTLLSMNKDAEATEVLKKTIKQFGDDKWLYYYLATASENLKMPKETEKHLRKCLEIDANDPNVLNFLGYLLSEENRNLDEAENLLNRALLIDPDNGFFLDSLGWIYYRQGKGEKAVEFIKRAIKRMTSDDAILRDHLGDAYALAGNLKRAVEQWERALRLDPALQEVEKKIKKAKSKRP